MTAIEWPLSRDAPDIIGRIVVIALDPIASVAALNDETATAEAAAVSTQRYLALVKGYLNFLWTPDGPRLTLIFAPGSHGLPPAPDAWAAVPLSPALPHGECTRPPVTPDPPLPGHWTDCYIYTLHSMGGTVSRIHLGDVERQGPRLGEDEQMAVLTAQYEDRRTERARLEAAEAGSRSTVDESEDAAPDDERWEMDAEGAEENDHREMDTEEEEEDVEIQDDDEHALMDELFGQDAVPRMTPHFEIWYDLAAFSPEELGDPAHIQSELDRLEEIEWEWAQRTVAETMAKGPETNAWLDGIGGADAPLAPQSAAIDAAFDDGLVGPEDAIEHRMEQGTLPPIKVREWETPSLDGQSSATGSQLTGSSTSSSIAGPATDQSKRVSPSGIGGLSVFRIVLRSAAAFVFRLRSFMWGLIFWRPGAGR